MLIIYNDVYYRKSSRKCSLFVNFWFSGSNLDGNVKSRNSNTHFLVMFTKKHTAKLKISEILNPKELGIQKVGGIIVFCLSWEYVPLSKIHPNLHGVLY